MAENTTTSQEELKKKKNSYRNRAVAGALVGILGLSLYCNSLFKLATF